MIFLFLTGGDSDTRGLTIVAKDAGGRFAELKVYDKVYGLIIGIDTYSNLPPNRQLKYCVTDARGVKEVLETNYQFERIETLFDDRAAKSDIQAKFTEMSRAIGPEDSLFVFIASHGVTVGDVGFVVPYDGSLDEAEVYRNIWWS